MGYISEVRCLIYGDPDHMDALKMRETLADKGVFESFKDYLRFYDMDVHMYRGNDWQVVRQRAIDLEGSFKWYENYEDVQAWHAFMESAIEFHESINYEFVRIGEEHSDVENTYSGDAYCLGVNNPTIYADINEVITEGED